MTIFDLPSSLLSLLSSPFDAAPSIVEIQDPLSNDCFIENKEILLIVVLSSVDLIVSTASDADALTGASSLDFTQLTEREMKYLFQKTN